METASSLPTENASRSETKSFQSCQTTRISSRRARRFRKDIDFYAELRLSKSIITVISNPMRRQALRRWAGFALACPAFTSAAGFRSSKGLSSPSVFPPRSGWWSRPARMSSPRRSPRLSAIPRVRGRECSRAGRCPASLDDLTMRS